MVYTHECLVYTYGLYTWMYDVQFNCEMIPLGRLVSVGSWFDELVTENKKHPTLTPNLFSGPLEWSFMVIFHGDLMVFYPPANVKTSLWKITRLSKFMSKSAISFWPWPWQTATNYQTVPRAVQCPSLHPAFGLATLMPLWPGTEITKNATETPEKSGEMDGNGWKRHLAFGVFPSRSQLFGQNTTDQWPLKRDRNWRYCAM